MRAINQIRKEKKYTREDHIHITYQTESTLLQQVFTEHLIALQESVSAEQIVGGVGEKDVTLSGEVISLTVEKV